MDNDILDSKDKFLVKPQKTNRSRGIVILVGLFFIGIGAFVFLRNETSVRMELQLQQQQLELEQSRIEVEEAKKINAEQLFRIEEKAIQDSLESLRKSD